MMLCTLCVFTLFSWQPTCLLEHLWQKVTWVKIRCQSKVMSRAKPHITQIYNRNFEIYIYQKFFTILSANVMRIKQYAILWNIHCSCMQKYILKNTRMRMCDYQNHFCYDPTVNWKKSGCTLFHIWPLEVFLWSPVHIRVDSLG